MSSTKVTLRKRELPSGTITLYLDFYPPITNPRTMDKTRREYFQSKYMIFVFFKANQRT